MFKSARWQVIAWVLVAPLFLVTQLSAATDNPAPGEQDAQGSEHLYKQHAGTMLCTARTTIIREMREAHGETLLFFGVMKGGQPFELFTNPETGTWTLMVAPNGLPEGDACVPAFGPDYQLLKTE